MHDISVAIGVDPASTDLTGLRYARVCILADADSDGAHIATLLCALFVRHFPALVAAGHVYVAMPPLYRLTAGKESMYARDDAHKEALLNGEFKGRKVEISRFKGLGEMMPGDLKQTTMDPATRTLACVVLPKGEVEDFDGLFETLMGKKAELRFNYIQQNARFVEEVVV